MGWVTGGCSGGWEEWGEGKEGNKRVGEKARKVQFSSGLPPDVFCLFLLHQRTSLSSVLPQHSTAGTTV